MQATTKTVDFVAMYPNFHQPTLKHRLSDALAEAWAWEKAKLQQTEEGAPEKHLRIRADGWVELTSADLQHPQVGSWTKEEVMEMLEFVIDLPSGERVWHGFRLCHADVESSPIPCGKRFCQR